MGKNQMGKNHRRRTILEQLQQMSPEEHAKKSAAIKQRLLSLDSFQDAKIIGITIARFPEVDTKSIIETAWSMGKKIVVPKCIRLSKEMDFRQIDSFTQLEVVYMGLEEPAVASTISVEKEVIDLQIVPGVVFSNDGYRIGYGGGYYDRYMADYKGRSVSLAFACQTGFDVPVESHDIPVQQIITEKELIHCLRSEL